VRWYEGNVSDYLEDRRQKLGIEAERPHRIVYRRLEG
jgi:energy-dependent translational throttle protein EttA